MTSFGAMSRLARAGLGMAALLCATCQGASAASLFWDWNGSKDVKGTGRQLVRLNVEGKPGDIIVSFSDRKLYLITKPGEALSYPVAIPREKDRWEGATVVSSKRENPSWTPTPTMIKENPRLPSWVPGGHPMNPLGIRALYLGDSMYRIHGTDAPWTIGTDVSKGCIRMYNNDAVDLYARVKTGTKVLVTWTQYHPQPTTGEIQAANVATGSLPAPAQNQPQPATPQATAAVEPPVAPSAPAARRDTRANRPAKPPAKAMPPRDAEPAPQAQAPAPQGPYRLEQAPAGQAPAAKAPAKEAPAAKTVPAKRKLFATEVTEL